MGGTILSRCRECNIKIDIDPLLDDPNQYVCDDCKANHENYIRLLEEVDKEREVE